jgi:hypothetical protein
MLMSSPNPAHVSRMPMLVSMPVSFGLMMATAAGMLRRGQVRYARFLSLLAAGTMIVIIGLHAFNRTDYGRRINVQIGNAIYHVL